MSKNIRIFYYTARFSDSVSLEMNKWKRILEDMRYSLYICADKLGTVQDTFIEEMYHPSIGQSNDFTKSIEFN